MIQKLEYNDFQELKYKAIFDYYDFPLSFVAQIRNLNYFFYYISDTDYFVVELNKKLVREFDKNKNLTNYFKYLLDKDLLLVVSFDYKDKKATCCDLDDVGYEPSNYLPKSKRNLEYDYYNDISIDENYNLFDLLDFPLETDSICVRVRNEHNDHAYSVDLIEKILNVIKNSHKVAQKFYDNEKLASKEIYIKSFSPGSLKIDFELKNTDEQLDKSDISFYPSLNILNKVTNVKENKDVSFLESDLNKSTFENIEKLYKITKEERISLDFYNNQLNDSQPLTLGYGKDIDKKVNEYRDYIDELSKERIKKDRIEYKNARFLTGSLLRNQATLSVKGKTIQVKFQEDLYKAIRNNVTELNLNSEVNVIITTEKRINSEGEIVKLKNIIDELYYV